MSVSVLFNEPKLLKFGLSCWRLEAEICFSTLQRAEIAEMLRYRGATLILDRFSTLQRAEIAEIPRDGAQLEKRLEFQYSSTSRNC